MNRSWRNYFLLLPASLALIARGDEPPVATLVATMVKPEATWEVRCAAEDRLLERTPEEVLPVLLPHVGRGMPPAIIWNSGGRLHDREAPVVWQIFHSVSRSWTAQVNKFARKPGGGRLLRQLLDPSDQEPAKCRVLTDLALYWDPAAEPAVARLLRDQAQPVAVRRTAGLVLIVQGGREHHELLLENAAQGPLKNRRRWYDLVADPRYQRRHGTDPRVITIGFELLEAELAATPGHIHGAYFVALTVGHYAGQQFKPDQGDPKYQAAGGLKEEFFADTVANAREWWRRNRETVSGRQP